MSNPLPYLLLLLPPIFLILKKVNSQLSKRNPQPPLPPGPTPWPIVGNLFHLGKQTHISITKLANLYGPMISLKLGARFVVVASTPQALSEILKSHDRFTSGRLIQAANPYKGDVLDRIAIVWASECNNWWRSVRTICRTELFSAKAIESQSALRESKVKDLVEFLRSKEGTNVKIGDVVFTCVFNMLSNIFLSRDLIDFGDGVGKGLKGLVWNMMDLGTKPNIADFYPALAWLDPQGLKRKLTRYYKEMSSVWEIDIKKRRDLYDHGTKRNGSGTDFLDIFIENGYDDQQINWLIFELFVAGSETTTTTIEWTLAELLKNKEVMEKVKEELDKELLNKNIITELQISNLTYLNACLKETLRLHPPIPFLIPHRATEECQIMNFMIPKDTQFFLNVYAIGRDPSIWEDPLSFKPERFIGSSLDFKGQDFEFVPFGSGRRICPGLPMATKQVNLILVSLLHFFDWSLPDHNDPIHLDVTDRFGITLRKEEPLNVIPKRKV